MELSFLEGGTPLGEHKYITDVPKLCKEFEVSFSLKPVIYLVGRVSSVLRITTEEEVTQHYVGFGDAWSNDRNVLYVCGSTNDDPDGCTASQDSFPANKTIDVKIARTKKGSAYEYSCYLNGKLDFAKKSTDPWDVLNARIIVGDPWGASTPGTIKDLKVKTCGEGTVISMFLRSHLYLKANSLDHFL